MITDASEENAKKLDKVLDNVINAISALKSQEDLLIIATALSATVVSFCVHDIDTHEERVRIAKDIAEQMTAKLIDAVVENLAEQFKEEKT